MAPPFSPDEREAITELARKAARDELSVTDSMGQSVSFGGLIDTGLTRRQALAVLGAVASGTLVGSAITEVVGGQTQRDETVAPSDTDQQMMLSDGKLVPVAPGLGPSDAVDPDTTETPVQDALDLVGEKGGGTVLLPPIDLFEADTIVMHDHTSLRGFWGNSKIRFPPRTDGLLFDTAESSYSSDGQFLTFADVDGVSFVGPGADTDAAGTAIRDRGLWLSRFGRVELREWTGITWLVEHDASSFDNRFEYLYITDCDAGDETANGNGLITWNSTGSTNYFGYVASYPVDSWSGRRSRLFATRGMAANINCLNLGTATSAALSGYYNEIHISMLHWEPTALTSPVDTILNLSGKTPFTLQSLTLNGEAEAEFAYTVSSGGNIRLPVPFLADDSRLTKNVLQLQNDPLEAMIYNGKSSDVTVRGTGETGNCQCIGDFSSVG